MLRLPRLATSWRIVVSFLFVCIPILCNHIFWGLGSLPPIRLFQIPCVVSLLHHDASSVSMIMMMFLSPLHAEHNDVPPHSERVFVTYSVFFSIFCQGPVPFCGQFGQKIDDASKPSVPVCPSLSGPHCIPRRNA